MFCWINNLITQLWLQLANLNFPDWQWAASTTHFKLDNQNLRTLRTAQKAELHLLNNLNRVQSKLYSNKK